MRYIKKTDYESYCGDFCSYTRVQKLNDENFKIISDFVDLENIEIYETDEDIESYIEIVFDNYRSKKSKLNDFKLNDCPIYGIDVKVHG